MRHPNDYVDLLWPRALLADFELWYALREVLRRAFANAQRLPEYDAQGRLVRGLPDAQLTALELAARKLMAVNP